MSKTSDIRNYLRELLKAHKYDTSFRLPSENRLAEKFDCARGCARNALDELAREGLVSRARGSGTYTDFDRLRELESPDIQRRVAAVLPLDCGRFVQNIFRSAFQFLSARGISCHVLYFRNGREENDLLNYVYTQKFDGILFYPMDGTNPQEVLSELLAHNFPVVLIDRYFKELDCYTVSSNHFASARKITQYLIDIGRRHICFLSEDPSVATSLQHRLGGFESIVRHDVSLNANCSTLFFRLDQPVEETIKRHFRAHPKTDAVITINGLFTIYVLNALRDLGKVPGKDVVLALYDEELALDKIVDFFYLQLNQNSSLIGETASDILCHLLRGEPYPERRINIQTDIEIVNRQKETP